MERRLFAGIFFLAAAVLLLELALTRIFDVVLQANLANLVVSSAIFGLGLGGIALLLEPLASRQTDVILAAAAAGFAASVLVLIPVLKWLPFDFAEVPTAPARQAVYFSILYLCLLAPFFAAGIVFAAVLTRYAVLVDRLYFWDLVGAGVGSLGILRLPTLIGPAAVLGLVAAAGALSAALLAGRAIAVARAAAAACAGLLVLAVVFAGRIEFPSHLVKRGVLLGAADQPVEFSRWDPVAKIDVLPPDPSFVHRIAYDGGAQSSAFFQFDGDLDAARARYFAVSDGSPRYNTGKYVALAHWLKRTSPTRVLVIGAAGGQETLAALVFGAAHVDAVEMVCTVFEAAKGRYGPFTGHLYEFPQVHTVCDEGRSFLRRSQDRYDIIQLHSNHTTSSVAQGVGGAEPVYLQTVEAYQEYLTHLADDGILQINYFVYPRMITTAARAWRALFPQEDFRFHLIVTDGYGNGIMPTFLVKRSRWTAEEVASIRWFLSREFADDPRWPYALIYAPGEPEAAHVPPEFFQVPLDPAFVARMPYAVLPTTDEHPFFRDLRKRVQPITSDRAGYVPEGTAGFINASLGTSLGLGFIPMEKVHLYVLGVLSIAMSAVFVGVPLGYLRRRFRLGRAALPTLAYFGCLGAGFIILEVVLMYKLMVVVGFPLYTIATVLFTLLVAAGIGSRVSARVSGSLGRRALWLFPVIALLVGGLVAWFPHARDAALGMDQATRMVFAVALLFPLGVCLGMPFPVGIMALRESAPHLIPWAWGVNGFMTVVGALAAALSSMKFGFDPTLLLAAALYLVAMLALPALERHGPRARPNRLPNDGGSSER